MVGGQQRVVVLASPGERFQTARMVGGQQHAAVRAWFIHGVGLVDHLPGFQAGGDRMIRIGDFYRHRLAGVIFEVAVSEEYRSFRRSLRNLISDCTLLWAKVNIEQWAEELGVNINELRQKEKLIEKIVKSRKRFGLTQECSENCLSSQ